MAKRRVNMRFVGIGLVILMALGVVGYVLARVVMRPNPVKLIAQAKAEMDAGNWDEAVKTIGRAIRNTKKPDPMPWIMLGDAITHQTPKSPDAMKDAVGAWNSAIQIDPKNLDVLTRINAYCRDRLELGSLPAGEYDFIRDWANKLLAVAPDNKTALYNLGASTVQQWLQGVETDPRKIDEACERMVKLQKLDPADSDAPFNLVRVKHRRAEEALRIGDKREANRLIDEVDKTMADAVAAQPDDAMMHMRYSLVLMQQIMPMKGRLAERSVSQPTTRSIAAPLVEDRAARKAAAEPFLRKGIAEAAKAASLVKPDHLHYSDIRNWYCTLLSTPDVDPDSPQQEIIAARRAAQAKAEEAYKESIQKAPQDAMIRMSYADMLSRMPGRLADAIQLLSEDLPPNPRWIGARGVFYGRMRIRAQQMLVEFKLDRVDTERDAAKRETWIQEADASYQTLLARFTEHLPGQSTENMPDVLGLKARLQLARNQLVDATQTLNRALNLYPAGNPQRFETMFQLAKVYLLTQQTGEAKKLLKDVVTFNPNYTPARQMFAGLLIQEGNIKGTAPSFTDGAITQIDELEKQLGPAHPIVVQLRLATLDPDKDKDRFNALFKSVPESNLEERAEKATLAMRYTRFDEAIRLLNLVRAEAPTDDGVVATLAQAYLKKNDRASAIAAIDEALKARPDSQRLALMKQRLINPEEARESLGKLQLESIARIADPLTRELSFAEYYTRRNDADKGLEHLVEAQKIAPEDVRVMQGLFYSHVDRKEWEKAAYYLERLAKLNVDQADGQLLRVQFALAQGKRDEALDQAKKLTVIRPEFNQSWAMLGSVLQELGRYDEAINAYQAAFDRKTENMQSIKGLVQCYLALNRPGKPSKETAQAGLWQKATDAKLYIETGQRVFPNDPWFREQAQSWELRYGNVEAAIAPREQAVKEKPDDASAWGDLALAYMNAANTTNVESTASGSGVANVTANAAQQEANKKKYLAKARDVLAQGAVKFPEVMAFNLNLLLVNMQLKDYEAAEKTAVTLSNSPEMKGTANGAMMLCNFYIQVNRLQQAEKPLRDYLSAHPENVQVEVALASLLRRQKRGEEALKVLEANADDPAIGRERVDTLVSLNRIDDAARTLDAAIAAKPTNLLIVQRAQLDLGTGKFDDARKRVNQVLASSPDDLYGLFTRARVNLTDPRGDINSAIDDLNRLVTLQPKSFEARVQLAEAYRRRKLPGEAIRNLEAAARLDPDEKSVRLQLLELYYAASPPRWLDAERLIRDARQTVALATDTDLQLSEARMWLLRKDSVKALDLIKALRQQQPDNLAVTQAYLTALQESRDYRTLLAESDAIVKAKPDLWWVYQYRGVARRRGQNDRAGALNELKTGLAVAIKRDDPGAINALVHSINSEVSTDEAKKALAPLGEKDPFWLVIMASLMHEAGDSPGGLVITEKVLAMPSLHPGTREQALKLAGVIYLAQTPPNVPKAVGVYRELLKMFPSDVASMNNLASLLVEEDTPTFSPSEAIMYSQKLLELAIRQGIDKSDLAYIQDTHAWALIMNGRLDEGISMLRSAMEKKSFADGHYHLGRAYLLKKPPDLLEAQRALEQAWQIIQDAERDGRYPDPTMKAKIEKARNDLRQKR